nr:OmpA family protein [Oceanococcus sp. HetDA_MAG_MS8]
MRHLLGTAILAGMSAVAYAGHGDLGYYINPSIGYLDADSERGTDGGLVGSVAIGKPWGENKNIELDLRYSDLDQGELFGLGLSLLTYLGESADSLYSIARLGVTQSDGHPFDDYTALALGAGLGYRIRLGGPGDLRIEGLLNADLHDNEESSAFGEKKFFLEPTFMVGYQIPFGGKPAAEQPEATAVAVVGDTSDSDADGVNDAADLCPDTPAGTVVDSTGCAPAVVPTQSMPDCPAPAADEAVDADGCAVIGGEVLGSVYFEFDSVELTLAAQDTLDAIANDLVGGSGRIEVSGHASDEGDEFYNLDLSQRRAAAVRRYLIDQGVSGGRIVSKGYGDDAPEADNDTFSGRRENRRVEVRRAE